MLHRVIYDSERLVLILGGVLLAGGALLILARMGAKKWLRKHPDKYVFLNLGAAEVVCIALVAFAIIGGSAAVSFAPASAFAQFIGSGVGAAVWFGLWVGIACVVELTLGKRCSPPGRKEERGLD